MLSVQDLINIRGIPNEEEITLGLLVEFYEEYLSKRVFHFELDDDTKVKLLFNDVNDVFHVSGIHQIYKDSDKSYVKATEFIEGVKYGNVTLSYLKSLNPNSYKDFLPRIRSFLCIDAIIKNSEYLYFSQGVIPKTEIRVKYILLKHADNKKLHLGIDCLKKNPNNYFARTLLVAESNKFIDRATSQHRVNKIIIENKETREIEETIDRKFAHKVAEEFLENNAKKWLSDNAENSSYQNFRRYINSRKADVICEVSKYDKYWSAKTATETIKAFLNNRAKVLFDSEK